MDKVIADSSVRLSSPSISVDIPVDLGATPIFLMLLPSQISAYL